MASLFILIPIAIGFVLIAILIFLWAVQHDQFDDLTRHGQSILWQDDDNMIPHNDTKPQGKSSP